MDEFYILDGQQQQKGPFTLSQLQNMWRTGGVTARTLYWQQGFEEWIPLSTMSECLEPPRQAAPHFRVAAVQQQSSNPSSFGLIVFLTVLLPIVGLIAGIGWTCGDCIGGIGRRPSIRVARSARDAPTGEIGMTPRPIFAGWPIAGTRFIPGCPGNRSPLLPPRPSTKPLAPDAGEIGTITALAGGIEPPGPVRGGRMGRKPGGVFTTFVSPAKLELPFGLQHQPMPLTFTH